MTARILLLLGIGALAGSARETVTLPPELSGYTLFAAPETKGLQLRKGDRLAICGDSITEQKMYSAIIESYLTACVPELAVTCRQYGWSGEQAAGFLRRMKSDVLRFKPTIATTCYGMNDFRYVPSDAAIAAEYRKNLTKISAAFRGAGCRVVIGSSGIIDSVPHWVKTARGTKQDLNFALSQFRNIALEVAQKENAGFADVYQPMLLADLRAKRDIRPDFMIAGKDGVHPGWAGQVIMARAFLLAFGLDGDLGSITWDDTDGKASASGGHVVLACDGGRVRLRSSRYPFSPDPGKTDDDNSMRAGLGLVPFDSELNRMTLRVTRAKARFYQIGWGATTRRYSAEELEKGVSLAADFHDHPLVPAFKRVWDAVIAKQTYETRQIKTLVHGPEGAADADATFALTEKARAPLAAAVRAAVKPEEHELTITAAE
jgi:lysophospholipase L1-like esterase